MLRKALILTAVVVCAVAGVVASAQATGKPTTNPGADCSHGNSNKPCNPDPQPEHGQDCDEHGAPNPAGNDGNEDHCGTTGGGTTTDPERCPPGTVLWPPFSHEAPARCIHFPPKYFNGDIPPVRAHGTDCKPGYSPFNGKCYKNDSAIQPNGTEVFGEQG